MNAGSPSLQINKADQLFVLCVIWYDLFFKAIVPGFRGQLKKELTNRARIKDSYMNSIVQIVVFIAFLLTVVFVFMLQVLHFE